MPRAVALTAFRRQTPGRSTDTRAEASHPPASARTMAPMASAPVQAASAVVAGPAVEQVREARTAPRVEEIRATRWGSWVVAAPARAAAAGPASARRLSTEACLFARARTSAAAAFSGGTRPSPSLARALALIRSGPASPRRPPPPPSPREALRAVQATARGQKAPREPVRSVPRLEPEALVRVPVRARVSARWFGFGLRLRLGLWLRLWP